MNYLSLDKEQLLNEIDNKTKAICNMGKQLSAIAPTFETFDIFLIGALNRTVNLSNAYSSLMRQNNFIAAAPLVRINIDTLLRLFASNITDYDRNTFALKVLSGVKIRTMKLAGTKTLLSDSNLYLEISKIKGMEWVEEIYKAGNSFVHLEKSHIFSSMMITNEIAREVSLTIGIHDSFIPESEKYGSAVWMNRIIDSIILQAQLWMYEKSKRFGIDIETLNNVH